jgi:hypothetical protein
MHEPLNVKFLGQWEKFLKQGTISFMRYLENMDLPYRSMQDTRCTYNVTLWRVHVMLRPHRLS